MPKKSSSDSYINRSQLDVLSREIALLRQEVETLKGNPFLGSRSGQELIDSVYSLNNSITRLIDIFKAAEKELIENYSGEHPGKTLKKLEDQNKLIAEALVSIHSNVQGLKQTQNSSTINIQKSLQEMNQNLESAMRDISSINSINRLKQQNQGIEMSKTDMPKQEAVNTNLFQEPSQETIPETSKQINQNLAATNTKQSTNQALKDLSLGNALETNLSKQKQVSQQVPRPLVQERHLIQQTQNKQLMGLQASQQENLQPIQPTEEEQKALKQELSLPPLPPLPSIKENQKNEH